MITNIMTISTNTRVFHRSKKKNWNCKGRKDNAHQSKQNPRNLEVQGSNSKTKASAKGTKKNFKKKEAIGTKIKKKKIALRPN